MKTGEYDVVSASGDASLRLIAAGDVAPVNTDLIAELRRRLALPQGPRLELRRRPDVRRPARLRREPADVRTDMVDAGPDLLGRGVRRRDAPYAGKVTAYDSPIYIADAALYLMKTQPDLGIKNPYALDEDQLAAAVDLLKTQRESVGEYWSDYLKQIQAFTSGDSVIGTTWQFIVNLAQAEKVPVEAILPEEGATGLVGHLDGRARRPSTPTAPTRGWTTSSAPRRTPRWRSTSVRRPSNAKACDLAERGLLRRPTTPATRPTPSRSGTGPRRSSSAWTVARTSSARLRRLDQGLDRDQGLSP